MAFERVELNTDEVIADLERLGEKLSGQVMARVLNRTSTTVKTAMSRMVRQELNLRAKDINALVRVQRASRQSHVVTITVLGRSVPLIDYAARQTARGVTVKVKRQGGRKLVEGAFIATMRSGHRGVFKRKGARRLPIRELFSTAVVQYLDDDEVIGQLGQVARDAFENHLDREIRFRLAN